MMSLPVGRRGSGRLRAASSSASRSSICWRLVSRASSTFTSASRLSYAAIMASYSVSISLARVSGVSSLISSILARASATSFACFSRNSFSFSIRGILLGEWRVSRRAGCLAKGHFSASRKSGVAGYGRPLPGQFTLTQSFAHSQARTDNRRAIDDRGVSGAPFGERAQPDIGTVIGRRGYDRNIKQPAFVDDTQWRLAGFIPFLPRRLKRKRHFVEIAAPHLWYDTHYIRVYRVELRFHHQSAIIFR